MKKIAITGPESTGKSTLAKQLAAQFGCLYVPEFARSYLETLSRPYTKDDVLYIAQQQSKLEASMAAQHIGSYLFCDTDMLVCKIWQEFKYGTCDPWIEQAYKSHHYELFLLCDIDIPWEDDPLREHPERRKELLNCYLNALETYHKPFCLISGDLTSRMNQAIQIINKI